MNITPTVPSVVSYHDIGNMVLLFFGEDPGKLARTVLIGCKLPGTLI